MKEERLTYPIKMMADLFDVSVSGYYVWCSRKPSLRSQEEERLHIEVKAANKRTRGTYSSERLQVDLKKHGVTIGVHRIRRIRKELDIRCKQNRVYKATTDSGHNLPVAENHLKQQFTASAPNQIWVTDITYIHTAEGWLYLAGHRDIFSGEIVGYAMSERMTKSLVSQSLFRAVAGKRPGKGLLHHSDRGSQYCSKEYCKLLKQFGMIASMSRRGNCYDNAPMESFWGTLKNELVHHRRYANRQEAIREITEYIEVFYNRQRIQAKLGYLSPVAYEQNYYQLKEAA
jgi:putative transposase